MKKIISISTLAVAIIATPIFFYNKADRAFASENKDPTNGLSVCAHVLTTKEECVESFGKNGEGFLKGKRLYPVKVDVTNTGISTISPTLVDTDLNLALERTVVRKLHGRRTLKIIGLGVGIIATSALVSWAIFSAGALICQIPEYIAVLCTPTAQAIAVAGALSTTPAMMIYSSKLKRQQNDSVKKLSGSKRFTLKPGQTQSFYLFVQKPNYKDEFSLTFCRENGNKETAICHCARPLC